MEPRRAERARPRSDGEQLLVLADPFEQLRDARGRRDLRPPPEQPAGLAYVGHEDPLVARPPLGVRGVQFPAEVRLEHRYQFEQAERVRWAAADVKDLARVLADPPQGRLVGVDEVADP